LLIHLFTGFELQSRGCNGSQQTLESSIHCNLNIPFAKTKVGCGADFIKANQPVIMVHNPQSHALNSGIFAAVYPSFRKESND
jgi:hypothetical protein